MTVYLIRHGKTEANLRHLYCGSTDLSLSEEGIQELRSLSYQVDSVNYVTSGMTRANETMQILFGDEHYNIDTRFREIDFGIFEMKSYDELKDTSEYQTWLSGDNNANTPPKGESGCAMEKRVMEAYYSLTEDTVVITHGGVIAAIMETLFPEEGKNRYQWQPKPGRGYKICGNIYESIP